MIVIPMAGLSQRFLRAGYAKPKYMLELAGRTTFEHAVSGFAAYFETLPFLFVARETGGVEAFVRAHAARLGIADARIAILEQETAGQAETVERGLQVVAVPTTTPITIFNIDTFRPGFHLPAHERLARLAGYLEVFRGSGDNWSYVRPSDTENRLAAETAEKRPISDLCCTGLYHFAKAELFHEALATERAVPQAAELYVAPLYNHLIARGHVVGYEVVALEEVTFCGTPSEYEGLLAAERARAASSRSNSPA